MSLNRYIPQVSKFAAAVLLSMGAMGAQAAGQLQTPGFVEGVMYDAQVGLIEDGFEIFGATLNLSQAITSNGSFAAFCLEPAQSYNQSASFTDTGLSGSSVQTDTPTVYANAAAITKLFSYAYSSVTDGVGNIQTANYLAFQAALWDLAFDDGNATTGNYALTTGNHTLYVNGTSTISADLATLAAGMLSGAASYSGTLMDVTVMYNGTAQNMAYAQAPVSSVPEPVSSALMLGGLTAVGWFARRRKQQAV